MCPKRTLPPKYGPFAGAAKRGDVDKLKAYMSKESVSIEKIDAALQHAATAGHLHAVKLLAKNCDPRARQSAALRHAALSGHRDVVEFLIPRSDMAADGLAIISGAARLEHLEVIDVLLPHLTIPPNKLADEMSIYPQAAQDRIRAHLDAKALSGAADKADPAKRAAKRGRL